MTSKSMEFAEKIKGLSKPNGYEVMGVIIAFSNIICSHEIRVMGLCIDSFHNLHVKLHELHGKKSPEFQLEISTWKLSYMCMMITLKKNQNVSIIKQNTDDWSVTCRKYREECFDSIFFKP